jgi:hypothetical protein
VDRARRPLARSARDRRGGRARAAPGAADVRLRPPSRRALSPSSASSSSGS